MTTEKIQKVLAQRGIASRREIERWIAAGRISINGKIAEIGMRVGDKDRILVDDRPIVTHDENQATRVLIYHKPPDEICTRKDPEGRRTVYDALPKIRRARWISIGRLELTTSGILLFTNSGQLAQQLTHPSEPIEREYLVRVCGELTPEMMMQLKSGVTLEDGISRFEDIVTNRSEGVNHWYFVVVKEGKNRIVSRLFESQGLIINRLKRIRFGNLLLEKNLHQGKWMELTGKSLQKLFDVAGF